MKIVKIAASTMFALSLMWTQSAYSETPKVTVHQDTTQQQTAIATDGKVSVSYRDIDCHILYVSVLNNLADAANSGVFNWGKMKDTTYQYATLHNECIRLRVEMRRLKDINSKTIDDIRIKEDRLHKQLLSADNIESVQRITNGFNTLDSILTQIMHEENVKELQ